MELNILKERFAFIINEWIQLIYSILNLSQSIFNDIMIILSIAKKFAEYSVAFHGLNLTHLF